MAGPSTRGQSRAKRARAEQADEQPAAQPAAFGLPAEQADQAPQGTDRREGMAQAARRHDAFHLNPLYMDWHHTHTGVQRTMPTFKSKRTTTTSAATSMLAPTMSVARVACTQYTHVSPLQIYELGPWSSARALVDARAAAQQERNDRLAAGPKTPLPAGDLAWTPARDPAVGPRARDLVPSLFNTCVNIVVEHLDCVETLWGLPEQLKVQLAVAACARRKLTPETMPLFAQHGPLEVVLLDCSALDKQHLLELLSLVLNPSLQTLRLRFCGRGLAPEVTSAAVDAQPDPLAALTTLALEGAYRMTDESASLWLQRCPGLLHLEFPEASKLDGTFLTHLPTLTPSLRTLNLYKCRGVGRAHLLSAISGLPSLTCLDVGELAEVDDATLAAIAQSCPGLLELRMDKCTNVTDDGVAALTAGCRALRVLWADSCSKVTDVGLDAVAAHCPRLEVLSVRRCHRLTDEALARVASRCCLRILHVSHVDRVGRSTMVALAATCKERLEVLDVSFCRALTDDALGRLVDSCPHLTRLHVFGCSQLTERFLHGHGRDALIVEGMGDDVLPVVLP